MNTKLIDFLKIRSWKQPLYRKYKIFLKYIWCNAQCPMCDDWKENNVNSKTIESLYTIIDSIINEDIQYKSIEILWWEPLLIFEDIVNILRLCSEHKITLDFPTNGSLLDIKKLTTLIELWMKSFTFSLDFPNEKHDSWRNLPGAFSKIIEFTKIIKSYDLSVNWNTVIWKFNMKHIEEFEKLYNNTIPNTHNFIFIEAINAFWNKNQYLNQEEILKLINKLQENNQNIEFIMSWNTLKTSTWKRNQISRAPELLIEEQESSPYKYCFIPLLNKSYFIQRDGSIEISSCTISYSMKQQVFSNEEDYQLFISSSLKKWCQLCSQNQNSTFNKEMNSDLALTYDPRKTS